LGFDHLNTFQLPDGFLLNAHVIDHKVFPVLSLISTLIVLGLVVFAPLGTTEILIGFVLSNPNSRFLVFDVGCSPTVLL
jgi:hypothetical protein